MYIVMNRGYYFFSPTFLYSWCNMNVWQMNIMRTILIFSVTKYIKYVYTECLKSIEHCIVFLSCVFFFFNYFLITKYISNSRYEWHYFKSNNNPNTKRYKRYYKKKTVWILKTLLSENENTSKSDAVAMKNSERTTCLNYLNQPLETL